MAPKRGRSTTCSGKTSLRSIQARTPKRIKYMEPDFTVVVASVEFFHYKSHLALTCPFFDEMLSSNMKEAREGRVEFPDKDPHQWLNVCKFLDCEVQDSRDIDNMLESMVHGFDKDEDFLSMMALLMWFDFLRLNELAEKYDRILAKKLTENVGSGIPSYTRRWLVCQCSPCPCLQEIMGNAIHVNLIALIIDLCRGRVKPRDCDEDWKQYFLDEEIGDKMWELLQDYGIFEPPKYTLAEDFTREEIVKNPAFWYFIEGFIDRH